MSFEAEPVGLSLVVCDNIHIDPGSGKRTLLGTFSSILVESFPAQHHLLCVYAAITECNGKIPVGVRIVDAEGERDPVFVNEGEVECGDPLAVIELNMFCGGIVFPQAGDYRVELYSAGHPILARRLMVLSRQELGEGSKSLPSPLG